MAPLSLKIVKGMFTLAGLAWAAWIALRMYFRQKEYELIKQRYLEWGVDIVAAEIEQALGVVHHNWTRCLNIMKAYRDEKTDFDVKELEKGFLDLDSSKFHRVPHHRLGNLIGSYLIWDVYQLAMAFAANANTVITKEIPGTIRLKFTGRVTTEPEKLATALFQDLQKIDKESHKFASLTRALHDLGHMLETNRLNFKSIVKFRRRPEVQLLVNRLQADFASELTSQE